MGVDRDMSRGSRCAPTLHVKTGVGRAAFVIRIGQLVGCASRQQQHQDEQEEEDDVRALLRPTALYGVGLPVRSRVQARPRGSRCASRCGVGGASVAACSIDPVAQASSAQ